MKKLLIANRGEIAVRVIRAAREIGLQTVAVASDQDKHALHTTLADEVVPLGPSEPNQSYLVIGKILDAARQTGADAIHPGYGFLSERAEFSAACREAGITFVGPPPEAMRKLGAKIDAKQLATSVGVPITPGFFEPNATAEQLKAAAIEIGFPVMLKASAGGGGRGMRVVREPDRFDEEFAIATDEALKGFGDGAMMVEKLIERPRHIEVQLLADAHGNVAALFERECSLQRRHQKLIEEAPSPYVMRHPEIWIAMRDASIKLAKAAGYVGAGTVEFMVDEATGAFYFLEVNARLQVEHPVTEMVTGLDLVQWQIRIAGGERLDLSEALMKGDRLALNGHAIEVRVVAEDPAKGFMPSVGPIVAWAEPKAPGIRVDTGFGPGGEVSRFYDSLLAKMISAGETRASARQRLRAALSDFHVLGIKTNIEYVLDVLAHPEFVEGTFDTGFLGREFGEWQPSTEIPEVLGSLALLASSSGQSESGTVAESPAPAWGQADGFRNAKLTHLP